MTRAGRVLEVNSYKGWWPDTRRPIQPHEWAGARAILNGESTFDEEVEIESFDGVRKCVLVSSVPLRDEIGTVTGANVAGTAFFIGRGRSLFTSIGCALCHTPALRTGASTVSALSSQTANLFSDLLLHRMGPGLADDVVQGDAGPDEFRTAPLWGLGQRLFFLHDGRTSDLIEAIQAHASPGTGRFAASEANGVIARFRALRETDTQDLLNFLRSL